MSMEFNAMAGGEHSYPGVPIESIRDDDPDFAHYHNLAQQIGMPADVSRRLYAFDPDTFCDFVEIYTSETPEAQAAYVQQCRRESAQLANTPPELYPVVHKAWARTASTAPFALGEALGTRPALEPLANDLEAATKVAASLSNLDAELTDYNIEVLDKAARYGLIDVFLQAGYKGMEPLFVQPASCRPENNGAYKARRARIDGLMQLSGFADFLRSPFAGEVVPQLILDIVAEESPVSDWKRSIEDFVKLAADPQDAANLQAIMRNNSIALELLLPLPQATEPGVSLEEKRQILGDLARLEPDAVPSMASYFRPLRRISPDNMWRVATALRESGTEWLLHHEQILNSRFLDWLAAPETGSYEEKKRFCEDRYAARGLVNALTHEMLDRVTKEFSGQGDSHIRLLVDVGLDPEDANRIRSRQTVDAQAVAATTDLFQSFYRRYELDCFELLMAWEDSGGEHGAQGAPDGPEDREDKRESFVIANLQTVQALQALQPDVAPDGLKAQGIPRILRDRFSIRCFGRYPVTFLEEQYRTRNKQGEHALALVGTVDGNWSIRDFMELELPKVINQLKAVGVRLRIAEAQRKREAAIILGRSLRQYGPASAGFAVAHGAGRQDGVGIFLSDYYIGDILVDDFRHLVDDEPNGAGGSGLRQVLYPGAPLLYHCCGSGIEPSPHMTIGRASAIATGASVFASNGSYALADVLFSRHPDDPNRLCVTGSYLNEDGSVGLEPTLYEGLVLRALRAMHERSVTGKDPGAQALWDIVGTVRPPQP